MTVKLKTKAGYETICVWYQLCKNNTCPPTPLTQTHSEHCCCLPLLSHLHFSPLDSFDDSPYHSLIAQEVPSPWNVFLLPLATYTSFRSQLRHHFSHIGVRSLTCVLRATMDAKDIFCAVLGESFMLLTRVYKSLETGTYSSIMNYCINKLFVVDSPMFSDFVDALCFWFPSV